MIIITGSASVPPARREQFIPIGELQVRHSRNEPGNLSYAFFEDAMSPGRFFFYEEWKDQDAVDFHFKQPYCLEFIARVRELASAPPEIRIHRVATD